MPTSDQAALREWAGELAMRGDTTRACELLRNEGAAHGMDALRNAWLLADLATSLGLSTRRADALEQLADEALDACREGWRSETR